MWWCRSAPGERGLSPVVGSALLIAIVVLLVSVSAVMIFGLTEESPAAPTASFELEPVGGGEYVLELTAGDTIDGDRIEIQGAENSSVLAGSKLVASETVRIEPTRETIRIVWFEDISGGVSYTLRTFEVDPSSDGISPDTGSDSGAKSSATAFPDGVVFTGSDGDVLQIAGDGGTVTTLAEDSAVEGVGGPPADITGDGSPDLPFVTDSETIEVIDPGGNVTTVAGTGSIEIATEKTRLAAGRWNGSDTSVFFVNEDNDAIYRAAPSGSSIEVATPGDGAQSVVGVGDIDDDGTDELVFGDGSQTLRYLEPDGNVETTGVTTGSNNGIGTGTLADFDNDGQPRVAVVDGGNDIRLVDDEGGSTVTSTDVNGSSKPQAKKAPTAAADVDGDDTTELVYVGNDDGKLKYLDDIGETIEIEYLRDDDGDKIDGSDETGTT